MDHDELDMSVKEAKMCSLHNSCSRVATKQEKKFPEFSRIFHSHNYTFPEDIATKNFGDWAAFRAIFSHIFTAHAQKRLF